MAEKDTKNINEEMEEIAENDEIDVEVEGYRATCTNTTKKTCLTDCIACTPLFTCDH